MEHLNKKIHHYKLTRFIGEGGMASVYEGTHEKLGTKVAVKILNPILTANKQIRIRFENEAKFMASLNHPNITKVLDYEDQPDMLAIVMELLEGQDLSILIKTEGALKPEKALPIFSQILDAFQYAHSKGIVHRDIKPSNIFLDANNQVKILDFGIAKIFGSDDDFTSTGTQMGTPVYMSPEQVKADKSIDHRSDIYSLGVTLFFTLNGKAPYDSTTQSNFDIFTKIVHEPIPDLIQYPEINQVIKQAVAKDRNQRFQQASEFKNALLSGNFKSSIIEDEKTLINKQRINKNFVKEVDNEKTLIEEPKNIIAVKKSIISEQNKSKVVDVTDENVFLKQNRNKTIGIGSTIGVAILIAIFYFAFRNTGTSTQELAEKARIDSIADSLERARVKLAEKQKQDSIAAIQASEEKHRQDSIATINAYYNTPKGKAESLILGKHLLMVQWLESDNYSGRITFKKEGDIITCSGQQKAQKNSAENLATDYLKVDGIIEIINEKEFILKGTIAIKVKYLNNGDECLRKGTFHFKSTIGRQYWRLQETRDSCEGVDSDVDIFFKQS